MYADQFSIIGFNTAGCYAGTDPGRHSMPVGQIRPQQANHLIALAMK
jgi:hypothetical protein